MRYAIILFSALIFLSAVLLMGCASIIHGTKQNISFQSSPQGAMVEVTDAMGFSFGSCDTPCTLELKRKQEYKVTIFKPGYDPVEVVIKKYTDGWIFGNILLGGIIGLIVDYSNGAAYRLTPGEVESTLSERSLGGITVDSNNDLSLVFIDFDKLTDMDKEKVVKLPRLDWPLTSN